MMNKLFQTLLIENNTQNCKFLSMKGSGSQRPICGPVTVQQNTSTCTWETNLDQKHVKI